VVVETGRPNPNLHGTRRPWGILVGHRWGVLMAIHMALRQIRERGEGGEAWP